MRVRLRNNLGDVSVCWFQFTHPCGCDLFPRTITNQTNSFNSRTRVGATGAVDVHPPDFYVSIHAPVWVRHPYRFSRDSLFRFQFTHPCGCDSLPFAPDDYFRGFNSRTRVGATVPRKLRNQNHRVSIHAPVWVRPHTSGSGNIWGGFQFTHPCGCDIIQRG